MPMTSDSKYPISVLALIFPSLSPLEFQALVESIGERGLLVPVTLWRGEIIDGRHRYEACLQAGVAPRFQELPDDANPLDHVMDVNGNRRHMSESQRAITAHRLWEESSSGWLGLGQASGGSANLHRFSLQAAAKQFNISRRLVAHAGKVTGRDSQAIPELRRTAEQGIVTVSDASKIANQPPEIQLKALELMQRGSSRTIAGAVKRVLQETGEQHPDQSLEVILPEDPLSRASMTLHRSAVGDLHRVVGKESINAIITYPPTSERFLPTLTDLASFAAHSLKPSGLMVVMTNAEHLPEILERLKHPEMHWVCELDYVFDEPPSRLQGKHRLSLRRRPLLVFGKSSFRLSGGDDLILVPRPEDAQRWSQRLDAGMGLIVQRFTRPGQAVCDPVMLDRASVALAALAGGCSFIGADREQSCIDRIRRQLASAGVAAGSPGPERH